MKILYQKDTLMSNKKVSNWIDNAVILMAIERLKLSKNCRETSIAITKLEEALMWIQKRDENFRNSGYEITWEV